MLALTLIMGLELEVSAKKKETRSPEFTEFVNYLNSYSGKDGCAVMEFGKFWIGMFKKMAEKEAKTEEEKEAVKFMDDLRAMIVVYYEDASKELKDAFDSGLVRHFSKVDLIIEAVNDDIHCYAYGKKSSDGLSVENLTIYMPAAGMLICYECVIAADQLYSALEFEAVPAQ